MGQTYRGDFGDARQSLRRRPGTIQAGPNQYDQVCLICDLYFANTDVNACHSLHHGVDKGPVPKVWALADPSNFKIVKELFTRYLVSCYSELICLMHMFC